MSEDKVVPFQPNPKVEPGGGGDGVDARLRAVEDRLVRLETRMEYMATKEDLQKLKIWILGGVLGGIFAAIVAAIPIALFVVKVFFL